MFHGGGWFRYIRSGDEARPTVTRALLRRVLNYARPYQRAISLMLVMILITSGLGLITPLIFRDLIDNVLQPTGDASGDVNRLNLLAFGLVAIPVIYGAYSSRSTQSQCGHWRRRDL
jgi:ATP-binding cassette subfamily B protein